MKKKIALGKPLAATSEELDMLALVTPEDIADARAVANQRMTPRGRALMEATRTDEPLPLGTD
jgi:hypothetical protein